MQKGDSRQAKAALRANDRIPIQFVEPADSRRIEVNIVDDRSLPCLRVSSFRGEGDGNSILTEQARDAP